MKRYRITKSPQYRNAAPDQVFDVECCHCGTSNRIVLINGVQDFRRPVPLHMTDSNPIVIFVEHDSTFHLGAIIRQAVHDQREVVLWVQEDSLFRLCAHLIKKRYDIYLGKIPTC